MEIYDIIRDKIAEKLKPLLHDIEEGGAHLSIQAEEEIHPFLLASLSEAIDRQMLVVAPGRQGEENIAFLLGLLLLLAIIWSANRRLIIGYGHFSIIARCSLSNIRSAIDIPF